MRLFFALPLSTSDKNQIHHWRENLLLPHSAKLIPAENFHITLVFLGNLEEKYLTELKFMAEQIQGTIGTVRLNINQVGYFKKPKLAYLGCNFVPENLLKLVNQLQQSTSALGIPILHQVYIPHISILRKLKQPLSIEKPPCWQLNFEQFCLYQSISTNSGVQYRPLCCYKL